MLFYKQKLIQKKTLIRAKKNNKFHKHKKDIL